jgi:predicted dinucleotide-binding enzyme
MKIGVLGTGTVGRTLAARLADLGHEVIIGTRDPAKTRAKTAPDAYGNPPLSVWLTGNPRVKLGTFAEAAGHGELLVNATQGSASLEALEKAGEARINGKVLIDVANPLDFSRGMPPTLFVKDSDSLAEQIQRDFPKAKVVKTLNTLNALLMANPGQLAGGDHSIFLSGNDAQAKKTVAELLASFGWKDVIDLGDITTARGPEMMLAGWLRLYGALGTPMFNLKVVR